jgi:molybdate transport system regulatory protein
MSTGRTSRKHPELQPRLRIQAGREIALGPGKAGLLETIAATGSIRQAALELDMSYMRAWSLVKTMNRCFREPLVEVTRGGKRQGGARLTPAGIRVLALYREMESRTRESVAAMWEELQGWLKR